MIPGVYNFHRFVDFKYVQAGPYLKNTVTKITRKKGDTLDDDQDLAFMNAPGGRLCSGIETGPKYLLVRRLGMPLQICQGRQGWLMPRLR